MLEEHKELIALLAEELLAKETLSLPDIVDILGPRPYPVKESVMEYLQELRARKVVVDENTEAEDEKKKAALQSTKFDPDADDKEEEVEAAEQAPAEEGTQQEPSDAKDTEEAKDSDAKKKDDDKKD